MKTGILLINLGTPDSPSVGDVRKYLREFLMDRYVIDIPVWNRFFLVQFLIAPFRAPKSAALYKEIWTEKGSPLLIHTTNLKAKLQAQLGNDWHVEMAMRYQRPAIEAGVEKLLSHGAERLVVVPLYPQYATSSTESTIVKVKQVLRKKRCKLPVTYVDQFYDHPAFIRSIMEKAASFNPDEYDHILFSFHGLPERQLIKIDRYGCCKFNDTCCGTITEKNDHCYRATCFATARDLAGKLNLDPDRYTVCFQSRLGKSPWIKPYSDEVVVEKAKQGIKKILVFSPAFVADCLETIYEIGVEYDHLFKAHGGEKITLVESLNDSPAWVNALAEIVQAAK